MVTRATTTPAAAPALQENHVPEPGGHVDLCAGAATPDLEADIVASAVAPDAGNSFRGEVTVTNNTDEALEVRHVVQVLDLAGNDVSVSAVSANQQAAAKGQTPAASFQLPKLPEAYYTVRVRVLASGAQGERLTTGQAYIRVKGGLGTIVDFAEWYFNSGAESFGGPG
jgi:hypothetical protein